MADDSEWMASRDIFEDDTHHDSTQPEDNTDNTTNQLTPEDDDFELLEARPSFDIEDSWDSVSCSSVSVLSSVYEHEVVHGRRYHGYKRGLYPLPNDDVEQQREEIHHAVMLDIAEGKLFYSDIGDHPQKIIDIGTGTGLWAVDVADKYPSASVIGTDLSAIQPQWVPVNVRMFVEDCEEGEWLHGSNFDLVHYRGVAGLVKNFPGLLEKALPHVGEGGWIEAQEIIPKIHCDDESMTQDDPVKLLFDAASGGLRKLGYPQFDADGLEAAFRQAGLINVQRVVRKIPISPWALDTHLRGVGGLMKVNMIGLIGALAAKPLAALDIASPDMKNLAKYARNSMADHRIHRYVYCCFIYGQRPVSKSQE